MLFYLKIWPTVLYLQTVWLYRTLSYQLILFKGEMAMICEITHIYTICNLEHCRVTLTLNFSFPHFLSEENSDWQYGLPLTALINDFTNHISIKSGLSGFFSFTARKPFQCRFCPYSASQKGNLKTHVLCVHRKPFDNSLYPDRRLRRSHTPPQRPSRFPQSITGDRHASGRDQIGVTSLCGTWCCHGNSRHRQLLLF